MTFWKASELDFRSCLRRTYLKAASKPSKVPKGSSPKTSKVPQAFAEGGTEGEGGGERGTKALKVL